MPKSSKGDAPRELLRFLETEYGSQPHLVEYGPAVRRIQVAKCANYPGPGLATFVTLGACQLAVSIYRGRHVGFELTLTLAKEDPAVIQMLSTAALENLRLAKAGERRPFIEYNGIYAPGYPPHLMFTDQLTCTPALSGQKRFGDRYVQFLAAIALDDRELREYDRSVPALIEQIRSAGRIAEYPRCG